MYPLSNNTLKFYKSLKLKKFRQREKKFIIEGIKLCEEAIHSNFSIEALLIHPPSISSVELEWFAEQCDNSNTPIFELSRQNLSALSDTVSSQGVLGIVNKHQFSVDLTHLKFILAIDGAQDPGNVGTVIRTADWFGVEAILLGNNTVELYNEKVLRASMGSVFHLPVLENIDLIQQLSILKSAGFKIYSADINGDTLYDQHEFPNKKLIVLGNESRGILAEISALSDIHLKIPGHGEAESLNMSVAAGILLSEVVKSNGK